MFVLAQSHLQLETYDGGFNPDTGIDYILWLIPMIIIFLLAYKTSKGWEGWFSELDDPEPEPEEEFIDYGDAPMTEGDWNTICRAAIEEAKAGNASARTWVTKNVVGNSSKPSKPKPKPKPKPKLKTKPKPQSYNGTPADIANDAVSVLRNAGHTKTEAIKKVKACLKEKTYNKVEDLISDAFTK